MAKRMTKQQREALARERARDKWRGYTLKDPCFGKLTYTFAWEGRALVPLLGKRVSIWMDEDPNLPTVKEPPGGPYEWQRRLWARFVREAGPDRRDEAIEVLRRFDQKKLDLWSTNMPDHDFSAERKHAATIDSFKRGLKCSSAYLGCGDKRKYVALEFDHSFDDGHGISLVYVAGRKRFHAIFGGEFPSFEA